MRPALTLLAQAQAEQGRSWMRCHQARQAPERHAIGAAALHAAYARASADVIGVLQAVVAMEPAANDGLARAGG